MQYAVIVVLALGVLGLAALLAFREKGRKEGEARLEDLCHQLEEARGSCDSREEGKRRLRQQINTVHLYAALSEEEARSASLREKQEEIRLLCESILRDLET